MQNEMSGSSYANCFGPGNLITGRYLHCVRGLAVALTAGLRAATYQDACHSFLLCNTRDLDSGYTLPLFREAWDGRSEAEALDYLLSDTIQDELTDLLWASDAATLDVERKHFRDKRSERAGKKVTSVPSSANYKYISCLFLS